MIGFRAISSTRYIDGRAHIVKVCQSQPLKSGMGIYKVCWCGGDGDCSLDEHFAMHVATLIINGIMLTVAGDGRIPNRTIDMVETWPHRV